VCGVCIRICAPACVRAFACARVHACTRHGCVYARACVVKAAGVREDRLRRATKGLAQTKTTKQTQTWANSPVKDSILISFDRAALQANTAKAMPPWCQKQIAWRRLAGKQERKLGRLGTIAARQHGSLPVPQTTFTGRHPPPRAALGCYDEPQARSSLVCNP